MEDKSTTTTDIEAEQPTEEVALTKNCDRGLDQPLDSEVKSASRADPQAVPNLQAFDSKSDLKQDFGPGTENISKADMGSNEMTDPCVASAEGGTQGSSSRFQTDATMPASLDCIRVLSSTNSMEWEERDRAASARSTRRAKKTRKQAKRFGFWVLSKIFV